ncbi:MAG: hypothetical protein HYX43_06235 [Burkholderiales bacterium]|nr:hypothetical protein [Burkholderiales bacterium]
MAVKGQNPIESHCPDRMRSLALSLTLATLLGGCSSLLPKARTESPTFQSFDEARQAIEALKPQKSNLETLSDLGLTPTKQPNTVILTHADIVRRVVTGGLLSREDLDPGILICLNARDACRGWELNVARIAKVRTGNFFADFVNFKRRTETTGWRFNALILLVNDVVVYRGWGGQPVINEVEVNTNPLGPLQDMGPSTVTNSR